jgi:hypothetical protein
MDAALLALSNFFAMPSAPQRVSFFDERTPHVRAVHLLIVRSDGCDERYARA